MFLAGRVQDNILPEFLDLAGGRVVWMVQYVEEDLAFACFLLRQFQMALVILAASKISFPILNDFCELRSDVLGLVALVNKVVVACLDVCYYVSLFQIEQGDSQHVVVYESGVDSWCMA